MNPTLQNACDLFVHNKNCLQATVSTNSIYMHLGAANCLSTLNIAADAQSLLNCKKYLKNNSAFLSAFRDKSQVVLIAKMSQYTNPDAYFTTVQSFYSYINSSRKWFGSNCQMLSSAILADFAGNIAPEQLLSETDALYSAIKQQHKIITNDEDWPFIAVLAASNIGPDILLQDTVETYPLLQQRFSGDVQSLSHALAVCQMPAVEKCSRFCEIFYALKSAKCGVSEALYRAALAPLVLIQAPTAEIVNTIAEIDDYLKHQKGFGFFSGISANTRHVFAAQIAINVYGCNSTLMNDIVLCSMLQLQLERDRQDAAACSST